MSGKKFLASTLLAAILLSVVIVPMSTQQGGSTYDAWLDYNEDGVIDVNDLHPLGGAYGTTGDPTKNVNVTNWPGLSTQTELFPRNLVLRGACQPWYPTLLFDETAAPCPLLKSGYDAGGKTINTTSSVVYNKTFVYNPSTHNFQILGRPFATLTFNVTNTPASSFHLWFMVTLGTISNEDQWTPISMLGWPGFAGGGEYTDFPVKYLVMDAGSLNVMVGSLERLAIRIEATGYTYGGGADTYVTLEVLCGTDNDYFVVNIPIVENP